VGERETQKQETETEREDAHAHTQKKIIIKTLNIYTKKKLGKGRGHTQRDKIRCVGDAFLSLVFVGLADQRCSKKKKKKKKNDNNGVVGAGAKYFLGKSVRVCVCFISSRHCTSHDTAQNHHREGRMWRAKNFVRNDDERGVDVDAAFERRPAERRKAAAAFPKDRRVDSTGVALSLGPFVRGGI